MAPGTYLARRRVVSGHTLRSIALAVIGVERFGLPPVPGLEQRIMLRLAEAEEDRLPLNTDEAELLATFVLLDPWVYRVLLDPANPEGPPAQLCRVCGASEATLGREPFSGLPGRRAHFVSNDLCSLCDGALTGPVPAAPTAALSPIGQQLRELGEQMRKIGTSEPPFLRVVPTTGEN